ncbi:N-acetylglucosamine repressor [Hartmannibacter diazotrophicus]|uniref:N-acetylglucosamine repressor n=1 Tax=Hartmannibacter diazotrophicus TaxID=1482074 RepID=A0A2C9D9D6_9HYPH|nr:ROK family transcriptional regulator [Hartmannibacter diazotrophicus]SON56780.1 N-acetylglucosamine repressor [Hartmannibacter diazotrophicus]
MNDIRPIRATSGTNQEGASAHNRRVIVDALRLNGPLSRADLARATRLTKQTVSNIIEELEQDGLVASGAVVRKGRGQPSTPYELVPAGAFAIGLQIDRHLARAIAVDLVGSVHVHVEAKLPAGGPSSGVEVVLALVDNARRQLQLVFPQSEDRLVGLGLAMPGPFGLKQEGDDPWMMAAWQAFPLLETLSAGTGLAVSLQNDAAAAATAERIVGAAHGLDHAVCLYLGYGLGAGLIINGELYNGANGNAGEIGMALLGGPDRYTALEHRASLASLYQHLTLDAADPALRDTIDRLAMDRDVRLLSWVEEAAANLRWSVHLIETLFDPETVILCGGAPKALGECLIKAMEPLLTSIADRPDRRLPRLQLGLTDPWSVALGAAAAPIGQTFDPRFSAIWKMSK